MEIQEGSTLTEKGSSAEIIITNSLLADVAEKTKQRSLENSGEFLFFIMGDGKEQIKVPVGVGYKYGVAYTPEMAVKSLKPYVNQGFKILADYHNHTPESVKIYQEKGLPAEYAFSPSFNDIDSDIPPTLRSELKNDEYPHLIGVYLEDNDTV